MGLERFLHLDDKDRKLIANRRRDYNKLGSAVQMTTVQYLGMFRPDPVDVPVDVVEYLAAQSLAMQWAVVGAWLGCWCGLVWR
ncbi:DUF4158 domain-containing protein [Nocardia sp. NPDC059239]|uniref:DUF4158 domain-containing protein n=1 Tax=unclassified Nocardia TaxID=2637762 RepID=UPI0036813523